MGRTKRTGDRRRPAGLAGEPLERRQCLAASVTVTLAEPSVLEGETHVATIRLSAPQPAAERVMVSLADGTATFGRDYFGQTSQQLVFAAGQTSQVVSIKTLRDSTTEGVENFRITATPLNRQIAARSVVARIGDYVPPPDIRVTGSSVSEGTGNATPAEAKFTITLSAPYAKPLTVAYTTRDRTATVAGADYTPVSGTVTFAPGQTTKTVAVKVTGDSLLEPDETFDLVLSAPSAGQITRALASATILNDEVDQPGFQITLEFLTSPFGDVPETIRQIVRDAAARWTRVIVGDLPGVADGGVFVDDLLLQVQLGLLDGEQNGPGDMLANAGPVASRDGGAGLPFRSKAGFDPYDSRTLTPAQRAALLSTVIHEIGHALGFAQGSGPFGQFVDQSSASFTGPSALREYQAMFGINATGVPLAADGLSHWDEIVFGNEVMTPLLATGSNPLSRLTIGAMDDMGYDVDYSAADAYTPPPLPVNASSSRAAASGSRSTAQAGVPSLSTSVFAAMAAAQDTRTGPGRPASARVFAATSPSR